MACGGMSALGRKRTTETRRFSRQNCYPDPELSFLQQVADFLEQLLLARRRRGGGLLLLLAAQVVDDAHHPEDDQRDDEEVDDVLHELAVGDLRVADLPDERA